VFCKRQTSRQEFPPERQSLIHSDEDGAGLHGTLLALLLLTDARKCDSRRNCVVVNLADPQLPLRGADECGLNIEEIFGHVGTSRSYTLLALRR
jgi:hypothetical protein